MVDLGCAICLGNFGIIVTFLHVESPATTEKTGGLFESWVVQKFKLDLDLESSIAGWWLTYPSEKYESVGVMTFPYMMGK